VPAGGAARWPCDLRSSVLDVYPEEMETSAEIHTRIPTSAGRATRWALADSSVYAVEKSSRQSMDCF
jgi:shikimate kinase